MTTRGVRWSRHVRNAVPLGMLLGVAVLLGSEAQHVVSVGARTLLLVVVLLAFMFWKYR